MPTHEDVKAYYEDEYYRVPAVRAYIPWHTGLIAKRLGALQGKRVLDIACGTGQWLRLLEQKGAAVAGMDISERALEVAKSLLPNADLRQGVAESLPFHDGSFDVVTCLGSLEHFLDQPSALKEMRRVAKPDGRFLLLVPNSGFLTRRLGLYKGTDQVAIRETVRSISEWEALFQAEGLRVRRKWRDLHTLSRAWILQGTVGKRAIRLAQAMALAVWPMGWQYQVYFLCDASS
jgi:SAM-dependent methyltransferase